jgi:hypothetical protein
MGDLVIKAAASNSLKIQSDNATNVLTVGTDDSVTLGTEFKVTSTSQTFTVKGIDAAITDSQTGTAPDTADSDSGQLAIYNGSTKLWGITEHGYVVNPTRPAFHVYTSGTNYSSPTSDTKYDPNNVKYNIGNFYDTTNDRATAPMPGLYHFQWFVNTYSSSGSRIYIRFKVNGSQSYIPVVGYIGNNSDTSYGITMQLKLEAGDYVEASWHVTGGGTASNGETWSGFLGRFVG